MSVEDAINYSPSEEEDYYALLSCDESSTVEQITAEYKVLALQYHPDKNDGDKEAEKKFQQLKYAKEVLCDPEKRSNYDKWRNSGIKISYKQWVGMKEHVQQTMHWSTPKTKDRMLPDATEEAGGSPAHLKGHPTNAHRRASEGGAMNLYYRSGHGVPFYQESNEVVRDSFVKLRLKLYSDKRIKIGQKLDDQVTKSFNLVAKATTKFRLSKTATGNGIRRS